MGLTPLNKEAGMHRLFNQRRIAQSLISRSLNLLTPGTPFASELSALIKKQGRFGSSDRRLYRELIFTYIRYKPWMEECGDDKEAAMDRTIILAQPTKEITTLYPTLSSPIGTVKSEDLRHRLIGKTEDELEEILPTWLNSHIDYKIDHRAVTSLFSRPPLWLRIQKGNTIELVEACTNASRNKDIPCITHPTIPNCIQAPSDLPLANIPPYESGELEVQDISSQILLLLGAISPKGKWLDACAGAGGKTLQLAQRLGKNGTVTAYDPRPTSLRELERRAKRSRVRNIEISPNKPEKQEFDGVLVDAPCSGSGTWRRHPYLMWQTNEARVMAHAKAQLEILVHYSQCVKPGGLLLYSTCSLSRFENQHVVEAFLEQANEKFECVRLGPKYGLEADPIGVTIHPWDFNGDGLFIAALRRK